MTKSVVGMFMLYLPLAKSEAEGCAPLIAFIENGAI